MSSPENPQGDGSEEFSQSSFPIVGIGSSAGGLDALKSFFANVSTTSNIAYVSVSHMSRTQPSLLPELLQKCTDLPVHTARDGQQILPNNIYISPPEMDVTIYEGKIHLFEPVKGALTYPIDQFLKSLALEKGTLGVAVILSGTGTDGTNGIKDINFHNGLVIAQNEETAGYDGMIRSAQATGMVDKVLPPESMPGVIAQYFPTKVKDVATPPDAPEQPTQDWLSKIFIILRTKIGHDFSVYKSTTIKRRISRRMGLNQIKDHEIYLRYLRESTKEVEALFSELLIGVTSFFREPKSFENLKKILLAETLVTKNEGSTVRIWVPGCSTGEEVYSLAIVLNECLETISSHVNLQIFGTDINNRAIDIARRGAYPESISSDVSEERLKRFFTKNEELYQVNKSIRDCVIFSTQDVIKDPPFSRLDLLCCRNLLIYLTSQAQKKLLPLFHYTLRPEGLLMLGSSETIGGFSNIFEPIDKKWKIYKSKQVPQPLRQMVDFPSGNLHIQKAGEPVTIPSTHEKPDFGKITQKIILEDYAPTAVLIDSTGEILFVQGRTGEYLEPPSGPPTQNIVDLARDGLRIELSSAIRLALSSKKEVTRSRISIPTNGGHKLINLHVCPQTAPKLIAGRLLVVFDEMYMASEIPKAVTEQANLTPPDMERFTLLEKELQSTRESHQCTIEELESSNEELKSTNEELQSANEELQSTNEELESSKEELQSLNEELQTVNSELQSKVYELSATHDDMHNLLNSTEIATIFVDNEMGLRRFTPEAKRIINLIESDIGRPLKHVVSNLVYEGMIEDTRQVLSDLISKELEVRTESGDWYNMRILPYRTMDNRIDGAVITFSSINDQKSAQAKLRLINSELSATWDLIRTTFDMNRQPLAVFDQQGITLIGNKAFANAFEIEQEEISESSLEQLLQRAGSSEELHSKLTTCLETEKDFSLGPLVIQFGKTTRQYSLHGRVIGSLGESPIRYLVRFIRRRKE